MTDVEMKVDALNSKSKSKAVEEDLYTKMKELES